MKTKIRNGLIGLIFGTLSLNSNAEIPIGDTIKLDNSSLKVRYLVDKLNNRICPYELTDTEIGLRAIDYNCDGFVDVIYDKNGINLDSSYNGYQDVKFNSEVILNFSKEEIQRYELEKIKEMALENLKLADQYLDGKLDNLIDKKLDETKSEMLNNDYRTKYNNTSND